SADGAGPWADRGERAQLQTIVADHRRQITEYQQHVPATEKPELRKYYEQRVADLEKAVDRETRLLAPLPARVTGGWFDNRIIPLDTSLPDQPGVGALVAAYNRESEALAAAGKPVGITPGARSTAGVSEKEVPPAARYIGTEACARCHAAAVTFWQG